MATQTPLPSWEGGAYHPTNRSESPPYCRDTLLELTSTSTFSRHLPVHLKLSRKFGVSLAAVVLVLVKSLQSSTFSQTVKCSCTEFHTLNLPSKESELSNDE